MTLLFAFLIGLFAGLRSLTPPAAVAWAVRLFVRPVQIEFAFVLDEAEPKVIDPAASA